jgi:glutamyl-tRNA synthetase
MLAMRGRFAPSPTGAMHLGNARTALLAWLCARSAGGQMVLRIEDLDRARILPGSEDRALDDLRFLGLDWDEGPDRGGPHHPYRQSERTARYDAAVDQLLAADRAFLCACSRADVARAATAPHDEDGPRYPGTCRQLPASEVRARAAAAGRAPSVRFRGGDRQRPYRDRLLGEVNPLPQGCDDFVIRRSDGVAAYQLAVVVDDAAMKITEVVRGDDLVASTPRQLLLYQALGLPGPEFAHVPLVLAPSGERLAKRTRPLTLSDLRQAGAPAEVIVGALAASAGLLAPGGRAHPRDLLPSFQLDRVIRAPAVMDGAQLLADLASDAKRDG